MPEKMKLKSIDSYRGFRRIFLEFTKSENENYNEALERLVDISAQILSLNLEVRNISQTEIYEERSYPGSPTISLVFTEDGEKVPAEVIKSVEEGKERDEKYLKLTTHIYEYEKMDGFTQKKRGGSQWIIDVPSGFSKKDQFVNLIKERFDIDNIY